MADSIDMSGSGSIARVAFDLLQIIRAGEGNPSDEDTVLNLYHRCLRVVKGNQPK